VGLQFGLVNRNINYSKLNLTTNGMVMYYDPNISIDESFARTRFNSFDLGVGIAYKWTKAERTNVTIGFRGYPFNATKTNFL
jgi:maltoporin